MHAQFGFFLKSLNICVGDLRYVLVTFKYELEMSTWKENRVDWWTDIHVTLRYNHGSRGKLGSGRPIETVSESYL